MKVQLDKQYQTRGGRPVELHEINLKPVSARQGPATFPVKGTVIWTYPSGRTRREYNIWQLNGRFSVFKTTDYDLVEVEHE